MASISRQPNGRRTVQFVAPDGRRKSIRLGKVSQRTAETIRGHVEHLVAAAIGGTAPGDTTTRWVAGLDDALRDKLARTGLIAQRAVVSLAEFLDQYIAKRTDVSPGTVLAYKQGRDSLVEFFGPDRGLRAITPGDADDFGLFLREKGYAEATVGRRIKYAKQFFAAAVRRRLIDHSPFAELKGNGQENRERSCFVPRENVAKVLEACPNAEWRLLVVLARYGGLRIPSEAVGLRWQDIDWLHRRLTIRSPKTRRYSGKATRIVPMFPELRPALEEAWEAAEAGAVYVLPTIRDGKQNLRTRLNRIILRAGLLPWPRPWQNMRASRATELADQYPGHVAAAWLGHCERIADAHYRQVTDAHFDRATAPPASALQNPVQHLHEMGSMEMQSENGEDRKPRVLQGFAASCSAMQNAKVGPEGFEPPTKGL